MAGKYVDPPKTGKKDAYIKFIMKNEGFSIVGTGFRKKKFFGKGAEAEPAERKSTITKKIINGKYIDLGKLKNNVICIRYVKTGTLIPTVKVQNISSNVKEVVEDIINDKFDKRLYEKLAINDKRLIKRIADAFKLDIDTNDHTDEEYQRQFEIVIGEWRAGNTSPAIKSKLKQYVTESLESGKIPRREAFNLLFELANS